MAHLCLRSVLQACRFSLPAELGPPPLHSDKFSSLLSISCLGSFPPASGAFSMEKKPSWHHFQERMVTTLLFSKPTRRSPSGYMLMSHACVVQGEDRAFPEQPFRVTRERMWELGQRQRETRCLGHLLRHTDIRDSGLRFTASTQLSSGNCAN